MKIPNYSIGSFQECFSCLESISCAYKHLLSNTAQYCLLLLASCQLLSSTLNDVTFWVFLPSSCQKLPCIMGATIHRTFWGLPSTFVRQRFGERVSRCLWQMRTSKVDDCGRCSIVSTTSPLSRWWYELFSLYSKILAKMLGIFSLPAPFKWLCVLQPWENIF